MDRMIFHHAYNLAENPSKGSELRPRKMKEAFQNIGYKVDLVVGDSAQRKSSMKQIEAEISKGTKYEFLYAESTNMPIPLTDSHHFPIRPLQDFRFFRKLKNHSVPIGFFYRDLYWRVDELKKKVSYFKFLPKQMFHWIEWMGVVNTVDHLFLPTKSMAKYFPTAWPDEKLSALYPGCEPISLSTDHDNANERLVNEKLTLLYVGGVRPPYYNLIPLLQVVNELEGVELILCCRENDWIEYADFYQRFDFKKVEIVHVDSDQITEYYERADIFFDIRKPEGYLKTTIPIKIVESIGYEVPLLLMAGTEPAEFVEREGAGWVVNTVNEAKLLLKELMSNRSKITERIKEVKKINKNHTWERRAEKASRILIGTGQTEESLPAQ